MRLRNATLADLETIVEHRLAMFREMGHRDPAELERAGRVSGEYFAQAIPADTYHAVLAEIEDAGIVGGGGVVVVPWPGGPRRSQPRRAWILNVYVRPEFRRRGIARAIMEALVQWCRAEGFDCVSLHASEAGRPLYVKLGFGATNEMRLDL
ncbi:MAG TPA: GNAT family N-acetyltransferase [Bryobacteraceae bacterium]|jgi:GNAT superfamily N-acetyltransferase|nr:GNAT family N-acetyltransferase [Bryobacteraceae bacterium]